MNSTTKKKAKVVYECAKCGAQHPKWNGQCSDCGAWNSLHESVIGNSASVRHGGMSGQLSETIENLSDISAEQVERIPTGLSEFDLVLGGGLVQGSVVLIGGDPGIGKSTLLIQALSLLSQNQEVLYVTGEESLQQVSGRANRLSLKQDNLKCLAHTQVEVIIASAEKNKPQVMVIDSIQTMFSDNVSSAPGSVSQVRETASQFVRYAKRNNVAILLVGHVTKEGSIAGPRVLEHMVDTVLYFEGQADNRFRAIRSIKNRFGAVNELGVFAMTDKGLKVVSNPSAIFLSGQSSTPVAGSAVMVSWEGTRPLLIEIQALVDESHSMHPKRLAVGLEQNRLAMLIAVLHRHAGIQVFDQDIFINAVGGAKVSETGADLSLLAAIISSFRNRPIPDKTIIFGEVGLVGEVRPVMYGQERLKEAAKHGFTRAIVPKANCPKQPIKGLNVIGIDKLQQLTSHMS